MVSTQQKDIASLSSASSMADALPRQSSGENTLTLHCQAAGCVLLLRQYQTTAVVSIPVGGARK